MRNCAIIAAVAILRALGSAGLAEADPAAFMMRANVAGQVIEGQPLAWSDGQMLLLGRDGALLDFDPATATQGEKLAGPFAGYSVEEMQARLREEFDRSFAVAASVHFVVVQPRNGHNWAGRFESLYRSFIQYMSVRGFAPVEPSMPLTAVVFPNRQEYFAYSAARGLALRSGTMGHYDPATNRVYLFDMGGGIDGWSANEATIIHEATHQIAYNVGVHRRFAEQPRWAVEGLAMMFEAPGVWNSVSNRQLQDRINGERLEYFRRTAKSRPADWITRLAASDVPFEADSLGAYAQSWVLTSYLCETRPQEYGQYLSRIAARKPFSSYSPLDRMADFTAVFGNDLELLTAQLNRFVAMLP